MFTLEDYMGAVMLLLITSRKLPKQMIADFIPVLNDCKDRQEAAGGKPTDADLQIMCSAMNAVCEKHDYPPICVAGSCEINGPFSSLEEAEAASATAH